MWWLLVDSCSETWRKDSSWITFEGDCECLGDGQHLLSLALSVVVCTLQFIADAQPQYRSLSSCSYSRLSLILSLSERLYVLDTFMVPNDKQVFLCLSDWEAESNRNENLKYSIIFRKRLNWFPFWRVMFSEPFVRVCVVVTTKKMNVRPTKMLDMFKWFTFRYSERPRPIPMLQGRANPRPSRAPHLIPSGSTDFGPHSNANSFLCRRSQTQIELPGHPPFTHTRPRPMQGRKLGALQRAMGSWKAERWGGCANWIWLRLYLTNSVHSVWSPIRSAKPDQDPHIRTAYPNLDASTAETPTWTQTRPAFQAQIKIRTQIWR
jgi:hypothetical protein